MNIFWLNISGYVHTDWKEFYELKIFTKIHCHNLCDSVTEFLLVNVVVVIQHLGAPG